VTVALVDIGYGLLAALGLVLSLIACATVMWSYRAWGSLDHRHVHIGQGFQKRAREPLGPDAMVPAVALAAEVETSHSFSLLVPARHEERVLAGTLERLARLDHPDFEVLAIVGDDDPSTRAVAEEVAQRWPDRVRVVIDQSMPKSKPASLNTGLAVAAKELVGVFDAEDEVHTDVLRWVDLVVSETSADVVQAGVQLVTIRDRWFSTRNCLEYLVWFQSRLSVHTRHGFVPLGGNTVFFRRSMLLEAGGWDPSCLAEDCEIGIRLSAEGARVAVATDPALATREETPRSVAAFVRQRSRWNQGYLQVLRSGHWRRLPDRRSRLLAAYTLGFPFFQGVATVLTPLLLGIGAITKVPLPLALWLYAPLLAFGAATVIDAAALRELALRFHLSVGWRDTFRVVWSTVPFLVLLGVASLRAAWREVRGRTNWEKTLHAGAHRELIGRRRLALNPGGAGAMQVVP
jgi:cellulose synthase/poly-beta-1,6-N-acetylglucosamine synthase-like glycosyltransferase